MSYGSAIYRFYLLLIWGATDIRGDINIPGYTTDCRLTPGGREYVGTLSTTLSGKTCQRWSLRTPHYHTYMNDPTQFPGNSVAASGNFCRNPDKNWNRSVWCYTTDPRKRWESCNVTMCECKINTRGLEYQGRKNVTINGHQCQSWSSQTPHNHTYTNSSLFPDRYLMDANSFCRNPSLDNGSRSAGPWCYTTTDTVEWEYCDVKECEFQLVTMATVRTTTPTITSTTTLRSTSTTTPRSTSTTTPRSTSTTVSRITNKTTSHSTTTTTSPSTSTTTSRSVGVTTSTSKVTTPKSNIKHSTAVKTSTVSIAEDDKIRPAVGRQRFSITTTVASVTTTAMFIIVCVLAAVILYKRGMFSKCRKKKDEKSFDNPAFNVENSEVDISYNRME